MSDTNRFTGLSDEDAAEIAGRMFVRAFNEVVELGCPLNCAFAGIFRAAATQTIKVANPQPLARWLRDVAADLEAEAEAKKGKLQ